MTGIHGRGDREEAGPTLPLLEALFGLSGRTALVTGGSTGLGYAAAEALAGAGADVTLVARDPKKLEVAQESLASAGLASSVVAADVTDSAAVRALVDGLPKAPDIVVNSAGTNKPAHFLDVEEADFDQIMGLNVKATFLVSQLVARRMVREHVAGSIIHVSSQMGHVGGLNRVPYCASKWGVEGMTRAMALDLATHSIRVNSIAPTFIATPMTESFFEDQEFLQSTLQRIKIGRLGHPRDLHGAVLLLASDASSLMTGTSIVVDGGWTAD